MAAPHRHRDDATDVVVVTWNIREMNRLFDTDNEALSQPRRDMHDAHDWATRQARVIRALAPDVLLIQEGPAKQSRMQLYVDTFLTGDDGRSFDVFGPSGKGTQRLYTLVRHDGPVTSAEEVRHPMIDEPWHVALLSQSEPEPYSFTRRPLMVELTAATGEKILTINAHLKSPFVYGGEKKFSDPTWRHNWFHKYKESRRRAEAEALRLRRFLDVLLRDDPDRLILVAGDFNDGPGDTTIEDTLHLYGAADLVQGRLRKSHVALNHVLLDRFFRHEMEPEDLWTAEFVDFVREEIGDLTKEEATVRLLLDHVFVSPGFRSSFHDARVAHDEWALGVRDSDAPTWQIDALPSDHRPVRVTLDLPILANAAPCGCDHTIADHDAHELLTELTQRMAPGETIADFLRRHIDRAS